MAVYKVLPEKNLRAVDIRDTLLANGADWSNEVVKNANYLPNYFKEASKINKWSRWKPVGNKSILQSEFDFPKNEKYIEGVIEKFGIQYGKNKNWDNIHDISWVYNNDFTGFPLRLDDFRNYNTEAQSPVGIYSNKWWSNRITNINIEKVEANKFQLSINDFIDIEQWNDMYIGFVVGNMVQTKPMSRHVDFDFREVLRGGETKAKVSAVIFNHEIPKWTYIHDVGKPGIPVTLPDYEGVDIVFEEFRFITDIRMAILNYDLHCGKDSIVNNYEEYVMESVINGDAPANVKEPFKYKVTYDSISGTGSEVYEDTFNPSTDLQIHEGYYVCKVRLGMIMSDYDYNRDFELDRDIKFEIREMTKIDGYDFDSYNLIDGFYMTMKN